MRAFTFARTLEALLQLPEKGCRVHSQTASDFCVDTIWPQPQRAKRSLDENVKFVRFVHMPTRHQKLSGIFAFCLAVSRLMMRRSTMSARH